ncbi:hypothetical protein ACS15_1210 [Ralstonia insidiosa]|uniref:Uncharacterized protein n=1 Tax=Ralstonia insidiosa TaxID=190721 RepID=A0AAC9BGR9_9RALS|nr:hypothetical protein ACS15_1210 [Ralstonia insidiosa]
MGLGRATVQQGSASALAEHDERNPDADQQTQEQFHGA